MESKKSKTGLHYEHCAVFFILLFILRLFPPFGGVTEVGMQVLSVFVGLIYGWIFIGFSWPSLFGLLALGMTDCYKNVTEAVCNGFSQTMVWQVFLMLLFAGLLKKMGVTEFIGHWMLSRKICVGHPWILTAMFFVASIFCGGLITMFASIFMLWAIFYNIAEIGGFKKGDKYVSFTLIGIVFFVVVSSLVFPFRPFAYMVLGLVKSTGITEIPMMSWLVTGLVTDFAMVLVWLLVGRFIFKIDLSSLKEIDACASFRTEKMSTEQKFGMILLLVMCVVLLTPSIFPAKWHIIALFKKWDLVGIAIILTCVGLLVKKKDGSPIIGIQELSKELNWDLIYMFAVTLPLGSAMESSDTGIIATIMTYLVPIFNNMSPYMFAVVALLIFGIITQLAHNLVIMIVFTPVLAELCVSYGIPPLMFAFALAVILQAAFMTPAASAPAALIYSNTDWIPQKHAYAMTAIMVLLAFVVICLVMLPLGWMLF